MQHYNFNTRSTFSPMDTVSNFFVNPFQQGNTASKLNLEAKYANSEYNASVDFYKGQPVVVFNIDLLALGKTAIIWDKIEPMTVGHIVTEPNEFGVSIHIYFRIISEDTMVINTVLFYKH